MTRLTAIAAAENHFDTGAFEAILARRVAIPSVSREPAHKPDLWAYVEELRPAFAAMDFQISVGTNDQAPGPFLVARRFEAPGLPTVLQYGHGDVVTGLDEQWSDGLTPWRLVARDGSYYGRGSADNKGQHSVNLAALEAVLRARGSLGFNCIFLIEMGEELGSVGLKEFCREHKGELAADVFLGSDGPRLSMQRPTIFLGARGGLSFHLTIDTRDGFYHSGNWGGLLSNPGVELCHAIATLVGPRGEIRVPTLVPTHIPANVRAALADCPVEPAAGDPAIQLWWGEPGLTSAEKVYGWLSLEVMEFECGNLERPLYAIPPRASARMQLRFPVGVASESVVPAVREHLCRQGFGHVRVDPSTDAMFLASRLDPDNVWVRRAKLSIETTTGGSPAILPNLGGSLPNNVFSDDLSLPTVWIPHSYPGCRQHGADEHLPLSIVREGLAIMAGLYWDLGDPAFIAEAG